jgi:hypothetical protein
MRLSGKGGQHLEGMGVQNDPANQPGEVALSN